MQILENRFVVIGDGFPAHDSLSGFQMAGLKPRASKWQRPALHSGFIKRFSDRRLAVTARKTAEEPDAR
jgi:hypothetical protein